MYHAGGDGGDPNSKVNGLGVGDDDKKEQNQTQATGLSLAVDAQIGERRRKGSRLSDLNELVSVHSLLPLTPVAFCMLDQQRKRYQYRDEISGGQRASQTRGGLDQQNPSQWALRVPTVSQIDPSNKLT